MLTILCNILQSIYNLLHLEKVIFTSKNDASAKGSPGPGCNVTVCMTSLALLVHCVVQ